MSKIHGISGGGGCMKHSHFYLPDTGLDLNFRHLFSCDTIGQVVNLHHATLDYSTPMLRMVIRLS